MGVGGEVTGAVGMEAVGMEATASTAGEAHGSPSELDHSGGRIGGHTGDPMPMPTPMATRPSSPCHPPKSMCDPQHRPLLNPSIGLLVLL